MLQSTTLGVKKVENKRCLIIDLRIILLIAGRPLATGDFFLSYFFCNFKIYLKSRSDSVIGLLTHSA